MIALAEDLLVLAGADRACLALELRSVAIGGRLDAVSDRYSQATARANRRIVVDRDCGGVIRADPVRLERALVNLFDNALRYGRGTIALTALTARAGGGQVEVHVTDEGPGFPPEFLPRAFERFSRSERARGRSSRPTPGYPR